MVSFVSLGLIGFIVLAAILALVVTIVSSKKGDGQ